MVSDNANNELKFEPLTLEETSVKMVNNNTQHTDPSGDAMTQRFDIKEKFSLPAFVFTSKSHLRIGRNDVFIKEGINPKEFDAKRIVGRAKLP